MPSVWVLPVPARPIITATRSPTLVIPSTAAAWSSPNVDALVAAATTSTGMIPVPVPTESASWLSSLRSTVNSDCAVYNTPWSSATDRPGASRSGRSDQWSPICTTAGEPSARATTRSTSPIGVPTGSALATDWVRSNRVNVPDFSVTRSVSSQSIHSSKPTSRSTIVDSPARHTRS